MARKRKSLNWRMLRKRHKKEPRCYKNNYNSSRPKPKTLSNAYKN